MIFNRQVGPEISPLQVASEISSPKIPFLSILFTLSLVVGSYFLFTGSYFQLRKDLSNASVHATPVCGTSNGASLLARPQQNLCQSGQVSTVSGGGPWSWSCKQDGGDLTVSCSASRIILEGAKIEGSCGQSNGQSFEVVPLSGLCQSGITSRMSGAGPWGWSCSGVSGGTTASCSASKAILNQKQNQNTTNTNINTNSQSALVISTSSPVNPNTTQLPPTPISGTCGSSNGSSFASAPVSNFCGTGSASAVSGSGPWSWICSGINNGNSSSCSASRTVSPDPVAGICGSTNGRSYAVAPVSNFCTSGIASILSGSGPWSWVCSGTNGGLSSSCSANKNAVSDGVCGAAHNFPSTNIPSTGLCSSGLASPVTKFVSTPLTLLSKWIWSCDGSNGGGDASCFAPIPALPDPTPTPESGSFTLSPLPCIISASSASCVTFVGWVTNNVASPKVLQNGTLFSSASTSSSVSRTLTFGTSTFTLNNDVKTLDTKTVLATCAIGTSWNGSMCATTIVTPPPAPTTTAAISFISMSNSTEGGTPKAEISIPKPSSAIAGDLLIWAIHADTVGDMTQAPAGWTKIQGVHSTTDEARIVILTKAYSANDPATYIAPYSFADWWSSSLLVYRGATISGTTQVASSSGSSPWQAPSVSFPYVNSGNQLVYIQAVDNVTAFTQTSSISYNAPAGYVQRASNKNGNWNSLQISDKIQSLSGATGAVAGTATGAGNAGLMSVLITLSAASSSQPPSVVYGACGSSNDLPASVSPSTNLCVAGNATPVTKFVSSPLTLLSKWIWSCEGSGGGASASCSAPVVEVVPPPTPINGACGTSHNQIMSTAPTSGLCSIGTATTVNGNGPWSWSCNGSNGGTSSSCSALKASSTTRVSAIQEFTANNNSVGSPAYVAGDRLSDDTAMPFRLGVPNFGTGLTGVPTFESIGLYWGITNGSTSNQASVRYRAIGTATWKNALPLWYDPRNKEYRGSIVLVSPGTTYEVETWLTSGEEASITVTTRSDNFPIAQTVNLPTFSSTTYNISQSGTANGYILYTAAAGGTTIDMGFHPLYNNLPCVNVTASYVIVRGLKLKNCQRDGVLVNGGSHDVVVEENDISGFGTGLNANLYPNWPWPIEGPTKIISRQGAYENSAVTCVNYGPVVGAGNVPVSQYVPVNQRVYNLTVQRNKIYNPRFGSPHWYYGHPDTVNGIIIIQCGGGMIIRYNTISSIPGHYFLGGIGGGENFTFEGFGNKDSDIYGNYISDVYDDGIESDSSNRNVRIWGNFTTHTGASAISTAPVSVGPVYVFRNINNTMTGMFNPFASPIDNESTGVFFKVGSNHANLGMNGGRSYFFHNTQLQPLQPNGLGIVYPMGSDGGLDKAAGDTCNIVARNNIFLSKKNWHTGIRLNNVCGDNDIDYNLHDGPVSLDGSTAINVIPGGRDLYGKPTFTNNLDSAVYRDLNYDAPAGIDLQATTTKYVGPLYLDGRDISNIGDYSVAPASLGRGSAQVLPNFNDFYTTPDMGAGQRGVNLQFGINAYR
jgi:hypothetical protein